MPPRRCGRPHASGRAPSSATTSSSRPSKTGAGARSALALPAPSLPNALTQCSVDEDAPEQSTNCALAFMSCRARGALGLRVEQDSLVPRVTLPEAAAKQVRVGALQLSQELRVNSVRSTDVAAVARVAGDLAREL